MRYYEAAEFLFDLRRFRMRPGTAATEDLLAHLGNPHEGTDFVQVAGSNGKGSTARMVESILRASGRDVGLYTSPHVEDVRDRITVDGRPVPKSAVVEFVSEVRDYVVEQGANGTSPTFFEVLTALALWHFGREDVDVGVLEVGIGGRLDATSAVDPVASAVTSVSLEHTSILGDTEAEIARDKAHVAPADRPLVTGATGEALAAIREAVDETIVVGEDEACDVRVSAADPDERLEMPVQIDGTDGRIDAAIPLLGAHQARNAGVAVTLARQVADVTDDEVVRGLRSAHWPGRFEVVGREPLVVLDGAHNPDACAALAGTLDDVDGRYDDLHLVFGAMHDKDHAAMAAALPEADRVVVCEPDVERAEDRDVLAAVFQRRGAGEVVRRRSVESALDLALEDAGPDDCVVVTGSLYTVSEARPRWTRTQIRKRVETVEDAREVLEGADVTDPGVWRMRGKAVHRVVKTTVRPRQARYLKEELLSLGGECAVSALNSQDEEPIDVVMMATMAQFKRLAEKLGAQPFGLAPLASDLRDALGIQVEPARRGYPWEDRTAVMGILNVTPDSFHDGGRYASVDEAVARAEVMVEAGASIVDVGGESTRPGADPVPPDVERDRILPVIERIADLDAMVSVDTRRAAVAEDALAAGADLVNDVSGLADPDMPHVAAEADAPLVVMHSIDAPVVPGRHVHYDDVVEDVLRALGERVLLAERAGLDREQIVVDPGIGFAKSPAESFELLGRVGELRALGCPVLVGHSHKSMFGGVGVAEEDRGAATVAGSAIAAARGADVIRVHDVAENVAAIRTVEAAEDPDAVE